MGKIQIAFHTEANMSNLTVSDNGIGLIENFDIDKDSNLGIQLIYMLAEQLDANVNCKSTNGVSYSIQF